MIVTVGVINLMILITVMLQEQRNEHRIIFTVSLAVQIESANLLKDTSASVLPFCDLILYENLLSFYKTFSLFSFFPMTHYNLEKDSLEVIYPISSYILLWNNDLVLRVNFRIGPSLVKSCIMKDEHFGSS